MNSFKQKTFSDRLVAAANARQATLQRFRARPGADDPAVVAQRAARREIAAARETRAVERRAAKLAEEARAQAERAVRETAEREEKAARQEREGIEQATLIAERKAARDVRYAARKSRKA
jgi:hypothetical protein